MSRITIMLAHVSLSTAAIAALSISAAAQGTSTTYRRDLPTALVQKAKITEDSAARVARNKLPAATIEAVELENEHGSLQYSYDMKLTGKTGIEEVNVNAMTGHVIGVEHESAATVKREAAAESAEKKKKP